MNIMVMDRLILENSLHRLRSSLYTLQRAENGGRQFLHMAPPKETTNLGELNRLLGLLSGALARYGRPDTLSFRVEYGVLHFGRLAWKDVVITMYPAIWIAERKFAYDPTPLVPVSASLTEFKA